MADVVLFHSVYGLRPAELATAERLRAAGHRVVTPDLYGGRATESIGEGFALFESIGWPTISEHAAAAVAELPPERERMRLRIDLGTALSGRRKPVDDFENLQTILRCGGLHPFTADNAPRY